MANNKNKAKASWKLVFRADYDSDGIGSCSTRVFSRGGQYIYKTEEYRGDPVGSLEEALKEAGQITQCCTEIRCPSLRAERLVQLLEVLGDDWATPVINGRQWHYNGKDGWRRGERVE